MLSVFELAMSRSPAQTDSKSATTIALVVHTSDSRHCHLGLPMDSSNTEKYGVKHGNQYRVYRRRLRRATAAPLIIWHWGLPQSMDYMRHCQEFWSLFLQCLVPPCGSAASSVEQEACIRARSWTGKTMNKLVFIETIAILGSWWMLGPRLEPGRPKKGERVNPSTPCLSTFWFFCFPHCWECDCSCIF